MGTVKIGVVAPGSRIDAALAARVTNLANAHYAGRAELRIHPQCFLSWGHFAGDDDSRADAFVEIANDPGFDAVWIARGGYGACRILSRVLDRLAPEAMGKTYLGYSDAGSLLAALYGRGAVSVAAMWPCCAPCPGLWIGRPRRSSRRSRRRRWPWRST